MAKKSTKEHIKHISQYTKKLNKHLEDNDKENKARLARWGIQAQQLKAEMRMADEKAKQKKLREKAKEALKSAVSHSKKFPKKAVSKKKKPVKKMSYADVANSRKTTGSAQHRKGVSSASKSDYEAIKHMLKKKKK